MNKIRTLLPAGKSMLTAFAPPRQSRFMLAAFCWRDHLHDPAVCFPFPVRMVAAIVRSKHSDATVGGIPTGDTYSAVPLVGYCRLPKSDLHLFSWSVTYLTRAQGSCVGQGQGWVGYTPRPLFSPVPPLFSSVKHGSMLHVVHAAPCM